MDYTVHGILQARILEWVAIPFSRKSSNPGIEQGSPALHADSLPAELLGKPYKSVTSIFLFPMQAYLRDIGFQTTSIKWVTWIIWFPSAYKSYVYINCVVASSLKKQSAIT